MTTAHPCPRLTDPSDDPFPLPLPLIDVWPPFWLPLDEAAALLMFDSTQSCARWLQRHRIRLAKVEKWTGGRRLLVRAIDRPRLLRAHALRDVSGARTRG